MVLRSLGFALGVASVLFGLYSGGYFSGCHGEHEAGVVYEYLGTKGVYLHGGMSGDYKNIGGCSPTSIWLIVRHGARLPGREIIRTYNNELGGLRDRIISKLEGAPHLCNSTISKLKAWTPHPLFIEANEKYLLPSGVEEIRGIAARVKANYPELVKSYSEGEYKFSFTLTQRAEATAKTFTSTLFPGEETRIKYPKPERADPVLRFYKSCSRWQSTVDKNLTALVERDLFEASFDYQNFLSKFSARYSNFTKSEIEFLFTACQFETAITPLTPSIWCSIFKKDELELLNYRSDLKYYWNDGYGYELTWRQACKPVVDLLEVFGNHITTKSSPPKKITSYFTHSGTLLKLISRLGLFNDSSPLRHSNQNYNRKWKTSHIDKFSTNLRFTLHKCPENVYKVSAHFQEKLVQLPACNYEDYCDYELFKQNLETEIGTCDLDVICG